MSSPRVLLCALVAAVAVSLSRSLGSWALVFSLQLTLSQHSHCVLLLECGWGGYYLWTWGCTRLEQKGRRGGVGVCARLRQRNSSFGKTSEFCWLSQKKFACFFVWLFFWRREGRIYISKFDWMKFLHRISCADKIIEVHILELRWLLLLLFWACDRNTGCSCKRRQCCNNVRWS